MKDIMGLMSKAKEMQAKMQAMQEEMASIEAEGASGGGAVKVKLNGKGNMTGISIDASLVQPGDGEIIEDLVLAAHNDAKAKVEAIMAEKTQALTAGLQMPPGFKLPF
ncbi:MAG: YbaB/EbfC family nucleoid-associated protein [Rhizobiaceae bacterium]